MGELWWPVPLLHVWNGMEYRQVLTVERPEPPQVVIARVMVTDTGAVVEHPAWPLERARRVGCPR